MPKHQRETIEMLARSGRLTTEQATALADELTFDSKKADALIALFDSLGNLNKP